MPGEAGPLSVEVCRLHFFQDALELLELVDGSSR